MIQNVLKRIAAAVCAVSLVAAVSGCTKTEEASTKGGIKKVEIWTGDSHSKNDMIELVDEFNKTKGKELGVEIEYSVKEGNITQTVEMAIASKQEPDMYKTWTPQKYYESGDIIAIDEIEGGEEYLETFPKEMIERFRNKTNGHIFTVPYYVNTFGIAYNKDMLKKYGLTDKSGKAKAPETYKEFRDYAKKMTNEKNGEYGIIMPLKDASFYQNAGKLTFASRGTAGYNHKTGLYEYENLEPAIQLLLDIKNDNSMYPGAEGLDNDTARALFAEGKIGMIFTGSYDVSVFTKQFPAKCDWSVAPLPVENKDQKYLQKMAGDGGLVINREMYERLGAKTTLEVFKWFHGKEVLTELYKRGCSIPEDSSIIDKVKPNKGINAAWEKFGELSKISCVETSQMPTDLEGTADLKTMFQTKFWAEQGSLSEGLKDLTNRSNAGIDKKLSVNPNLKKEYYIDADYDVRR